MANFLGRGESIDEDFTEKNCTVNKGECWQHHRGPLELDPMRLEGVERYRNDCIFK